jgi:Yip1-like protein
MFKALLFIFWGGPAWDRVAQARRSLMFIFTLYLLPMLLIVGAAEGYGLKHWGKWQSTFGQYRNFTTREVEVFEAIQLLLALTVVLVCAQLVKIMAETFHGRHTYTQAFTLVAYGLSPLFLFRLLDAHPLMNPWITWALGIVLSVSVVYQGLPRVMAPDPTHAFGLYLVSSMVLVLATFLARLFTAFYLSGTINFQHSFLSHLLGQ